MNYPRVTIEIVERAAREDDFPPGNYKNLQVLFGSSLKTKTYKIHYNNPAGKHLSADRDLNRIILAAINLVKATASRYADTPTNKKVNKMFRDRSKWVKLALGDPGLTRQQREMIQSIQLVPIKKRSQFMAELATCLEPLIRHLTDRHHLSIKECRGLVVEFLHGLLPDVPAIQNIEDNDALEKAIRKTLT